MIPLSILDLAFINEGSAAAEVLQRRGTDVASLLYSLHHTIILPFKAIILKSYVLQTYCPFFRSSFGRGNFWIAAGFATGRGAPTGKCGSKGRTAESEVR